MILFGEVSTWIIVLIGGENILELEEQDDSLKVRICSIAHDILYTASKS